MQGEWPSMRSDGHIEKRGTSTDYPLSTGHPGSQFIAFVSFTFWMFPFVPSVPAPCSIGLVWPLKVVSISASVTLFLFIFLSFWKQCICPVIVTSRPRAWAQLISCGSFSSYSLFQKELWDLFFCIIKTRISTTRGLLWCSVIKNLPANALDIDSIPDLGRSYMLQSNSACAP